MPRGCKLCDRSIKECIFITDISISQPDDSEMDGNLQIYKCLTCMFYFISTTSIELDYEKYYLKHNNHKIPSHHLHDKTHQTYTFLRNNIKNISSSILDYGCGNKELYHMLKDTFPYVDCYDIGGTGITKKYDYIIISHVLEHIYDPKQFLKSIKQYLNENAYIYIEVPNADCYNTISEGYGILQEINIEHINFFTVNSLVKFISDIEFSSDVISIGSCNLNNIDYPVIRCLFKLKELNSFEHYVSDGKKLLDNMIVNLPECTDNIVVYGCGQFLYKIITYLKNKYNIVAVIDDNPNFKDKTILDLPIYNSNWLVTNYSDRNITIAITSPQHNTRIKTQLSTLGIKYSLLNVV